MNDWSYHELAPTDDRDNAAPWTNKAKDQAERTRKRTRMQALKYDYARRCIQAAPPFAVRWLSRMYCAQVIDIDGVAFPQPLDENDLLHFGKLPDSVTFVATPQHLPNVVAGFAMGRLRKDQHCLRIHRVAVAPAWRRRGVGFLLAQRFQATALKLGRPGVVADVADDHLDAHLWLQACGFGAAVCKHNPNKYRFTWWRSQ